MENKYNDIWTELNKLGYDKNDDVIPYIMFNEACDIVNVDPENIMDDFSNMFNIDIG